MKRTAILFLIAFAGCSKAVSTPGPQPKTHSEPPRLTDDAGPNVNRFGFDLFAALRKTEPGRNILVSPYSISTALAMTAVGAWQNTREELRTVVYLPDDPTADANYAHLAAQLKSGKGFELTTANSIWAQDKFPWEETFQRRLKGYGVNAFREVDFMSDPDAARKQINQWAQTQTKEKIKDLLKPGTVTVDTRMVLANAIYFKGEWASKFDPKLTKDGPFSNADGSKSNVPFMNHNNVSAEMTGDDSVTILALPYVGNDLQMVIVLPRKEDGLKEVEASLNEPKWALWMKRLQKANGMEVSLPKFKFEAEYKLNGTLAAMGMPDAFDKNVANFSSMTEAVKLHISHVAHKAFMEVNEEGTEAAAATAVGMGAMSAIITPPFIVNRPFLFAIRHRGTGAILFLGRVEKL